MLELTIRLVVSLAIVIGLLLVLARFGARKFRGGDGALVNVVHRQPLSRTSAVAVVTVGSRVLVLGTTEQQVSVLAELDPDELDEVPELTDVSFLPEPVVEDGAGARRRLIEAIPLEGALTSRKFVQGAVVESPVAPAAPAAPARKARGSHRAGPAPKATTAGSAPAQGALAGSILSAQTWRQAFNAARRAS